MDNPDSITELTDWWHELKVSVDSKDVISRFIKKINQQKKNSALIEGSVEVCENAAKDMICKIADMMFFFFLIDS